MIGMVSIYLGLALIVGGVATGFDWPGVSPSSSPAGCVCLLAGCALVLLGGAIS